MLLLVCGLLAGCGGAASIAPPPPTQPHVYSLAGNWNIAMNSTATPGSVLDFGGNLTTSASAISGTLFVITRADDGSGATTTPCFDLFSPVAFSGTVDGSGTVKLVSAALANQIVTITGTLSNDNEVVNGSYQVTAADSKQPSCGSGDSGSSSANVMQPLYGTYTGTLKPDGGTPLPATLQIEESTVPDAFASLHLTGSLSVPGWPHEPGRHYHRR
jgi:hypothetical protein